MRYTKEEYRNSFKTVAGRANMRALLKALGISEWNYYEFLKGNDNRLSIKKCEEIRIELEKTPAIKEGKTKDQYRELFRKYSYYFKMSKLLKDIGIAKGNYTGFMSGDDNRLSYKRCEILLNTLKNIKIKSI